MADDATNQVERCETIIGYQFTGKSLCLEALHTHPSTVVLGGRLVQVRKNGHVAVLGDSVLKSHLCQLWFSTGRPKGLATPLPVRLQPG